jgi:hypothetical protein
MRVAFFRISSKTSFKSSGDDMGFGFGLEVEGLEVADGYDPAPSSAW